VRQVRWRRPARRSRIRARSRSAPSLPLAASSACAGGLGKQGLSASRTWIDEPWRTTTRASSASWRRLQIPLGNECDPTASSCSPPRSAGRRAAVQAQPHAHRLRRPRLGRRESTRPRSSTSRARVRVRAASQLLDRQALSPRRRCAHLDTYYREADGEARERAFPCSAESSTWRTTTRSQGRRTHRAIASTPGGRHPRQRGRQLGAAGGSIRGRGATARPAPSFSVRHHQSSARRVTTTCGSKWPGLGRTRRQLRRPDGQVGRQALAALSTAYSSSSRPARRPGDRDDRAAQVGRRQRDVASWAGGCRMRSHAISSCWASWAVDRIKPDAAPARNLTKLTIAPTLSKAEGFSSRPELRMFLTHARWNGVAMRLRARAADGPGRRQDPRDSVGLQFRLVVRSRRELPVPSGAEARGSTWLLRRKRHRAK